MARLERLISLVTLQGIAVTYTTLGEGKSSTQKCLWEGKMSQEKSWQVRSNSPM